MLSYFFFHASVGKAYFKETLREKVHYCFLQKYGLKKKETQAGLLQEPSLYAMVLYLTVCYKWICIVEFSNEILLPKLELEASYSLTQSNLLFLKLFLSDYMQV